ncbi:cytochrome P450 [Desarmillaria tabescens]|uniref:Cytochrome P450 n=1 Tax=Armillaria tabescens TaxID=1929756 RepID=A0AA39NJD8_ARMTA|nr:cytochrome P450 [Desarmillaria tabescens]KAK0466747.1 cytochrome P450 [Desarmillaria tabescens]
MVLGWNEDHLFENKYQTFQDAGWDIVSQVSVFPSGVQFVVADVALIKEITSSRSRFPKPVKLYEALSTFGSNIVASEGELWKKYRKICAPGFSEANNKLVWEETMKIMQELFHDVWRDEEEAKAENVLDITLAITQFIIGIAGFGRNMSWQRESNIPEGHSMTFRDALYHVCDGASIKIILPRLAMGLTAKWRRVRDAYDELQSYMLEMIRHRRTSDKKEERYDLFSGLLDANEGDISQLSESELIGNIFIFFLAGHETTAHTLAYTFTMLALYPDEQEKLYQHINAIVPDNRVPTYEMLPLFTYSLAVFNETLRMFPVVTGIPKISAEDTVLIATSATGEHATIPVPKGASVFLDVPGLHYNPRYWKDPDTFNPSRFLGDWPKEAFMPFSLAARACLGRGFAETEAIAVITLLISRYKIEVTEEPQFWGETFEERKNRMLKSKGGLSLTPLRMPLTFRRR